MLVIQPRLELEVPDGHRFCNGCRFLDTGRDAWCPLFQQFLIMRTVADAETEVLRAP